MAAEPLRVGQMAQRFELTVQTIHVSGDDGLIQPISRRESGDRLCRGEVFAPLTLIRTLKVTDIPLQDLTRILESWLGHLDQKLNALPSSWEDCAGRNPSAA